MFNSAACLLAGRAGLRTNACHTLSGVLTFFSGPGGFFIITLPVAQKLFTHRRIVLWLGTAPRRPMSKCRRKSCWVTETVSPLLTNASYTNTRCSTGQVSIATEVANPEEKNADHPPPQPTYWVLPIQKMSDSCGSPCTLLPMFYQCYTLDFVISPVAYIFTYLTG